MPWVEVGDRVWCRRYQPYDVTVSVVRGDRGLVVVDTRSSHLEADEVIDHLAELGPAPVHAVVNTHAHFDHTFGNQRFAELGVPVWGHELVPAHLDAFERPDLAELQDRDDEEAATWRGVVVTPPTVLVGASGSIDLGDRAVETHHLGRGHTDNDLFLHVPDAGVWLAGDEIEQSGPPMYGSGSFPLDWPQTIDRFLGLVGEDDVVVPSHGTPVDRAFVVAQRRDLATVADLVRELHDAGVSVEDAVTVGGRRWPVPDEFARSAVRDGYAALGAPGAAGVLPA